MSPGLRDLAWPIAVWTAAGLVLMATAAAAGVDPLESRTWVRADSRLYLSIAADGYELMPCGGGSDVLCGNAGWFPAYPWVVGAVSRLGPGLPPVGVLVAWGFSLATVVLLWCTFLRSEPLAQRLVLTTFAAFIPGVVYHRAVFPLSMLAFFTLLHLWLLSRHRFVSGGLAGAAAAASYHLGGLLIPVGVAFAYFGDRSATRRDRLRRAAVTGGLMSAGMLVVFAVMEIQTGSWNAYFLLQDKYEHGWHLPNEVIVDTVITPLIEDPVDRFDVFAVQTALVGLTVLGVIAWCVRRRRDLQPTDWLLLGATLITWGVPLTQANVSLYRLESALLPLVVLLRRLPQRLQLAVTVAAVLISIPLAALFFKSRLV